MNNDEEVNKENNKSKKIYLDFNGTTPLSPSVISKINSALTTLWGNPSSKSTNGIQAKQSIKDARNKVCKMINGNNSDEVIFMSGGTEANNHIIWNAIKYFNESFGGEHSSPYKNKKPHFISSTIEHDSIASPLKTFEREGMIDVTYVNVSKELGFVDPDDIIEAIRDETILITIMLANNETGVIQPLKEICYKLKNYIDNNRRKYLPRIYVHTDAAQCIGKINVDVQHIGVDYLTIVGHKFYAPRIGALWVRTGCPYYTMLLGGGQESGKRSGTENTCMIVGLGEAAHLVTENIEKYNNHFCSMTNSLREKLKKTFSEKIVFNTPLENSLPNTLNVSFVGSGLQGSKVLASCKQLEASVGAACHSQSGLTVSRILLYHHIPEELAGNAVRLSIGRETTKNDITSVVEDLHLAVKHVENLI